LHAIGEPAAYASAHTHALPSISAARQADSIEATLFSVGHCVGSLLADSWQLWDPHAELADELRQGGKVPDVPLILLVALATDPGQGLFLSEQRLRELSDHRRAF
jgi:hypothetical protein